jgi:hypothetical protein
VDKEIDKEKQEYPDEESLMTRRDALLSMGKWSKVVIGTVVFGALLGTSEEAEAGVWANRRGGRTYPWANGGSAWRNGGGHGGTGWANRRGGGGAWKNGGRSWVNRRGLGGWVN